MILRNIVVRESGGGCVIEAQNPDLLANVVFGELRDLADNVAAEALNDERPHSLSARATGRHATILCP